MWKHWHCLQFLAALCKLFITSKNLFIGRRHFLLIVFRLFPGFYSLFLRYTLEREVGSFLMMLHDCCRVITHSILPIKNKNCYSTSKQWWNWKCRWKETVYKTIEFFHHHHYNASFVCHTLPKLHCITNVSIILLCTGTFNASYPWSETSGIALRHSYVMWKSCVKKL